MTRFTAPFALVCLLAPATDSLAQKKTVAERMPALLEMLSREEKDAWVAIKDTIDGIVKIGAPAVPHLLEALTPKGVNTLAYRNLVKNSVRALLRMDPGSFVDELIEIARRPLRTEPRSDSGILEGFDAVLPLLGKTRQRRAGDAIVEVYVKFETALLVPCRRRCVTALGDLGHPGLVDSVGKGIPYANKLDAKLVADYITRVPSPKAIPHVLRGMQKAKSFAECRAFLPSLEACAKKRDSGLARQLLKA